MAIPGYPLFLDYSTLPKLQEQTAQAVSEALPLCKNHSSLIAQFCATDKSVDTYAMIRFFKRHLVEETEKPAHVIKGAKPLKMTQERELILLAKRFFAMKHAHYIHALSYDQRNALLGIEDGNIDHFMLYVDGVEMLRVYEITDVYNKCDTFVFFNEDWYGPHSVDPLLENSIVALAYLAKHSYFPTDQPVRGDVVMYLSGTTVLHYALVERVSGDQVWVQAKNGSEHYYEQPLEAVLPMYGDAVIFLKSFTPKFFFYLKNFLFECNVDIDLKIAHFCERTAQSYQALTPHESPERRLLRCAESYFRYMADVNHEEISATLALTDFMRHIPGISVYEGFLANSDDCSCNVLFDNFPWHNKRHGKVCPLLSDVATGVAFLTTQGFEAVEKPFPGAVVGYHDRAKFQQWGLVETVSKGLVVVVSQMAYGIYRHRLDLTLQGSNETRFFNPPGALRLSVATA